MDHSSFRKICTCSQLCGLQGKYSLSFFFHLGAQRTVSPSSSLLSAVQHFALSYRHLQTCVVLHQCAQLCPVVGSLQSCLEPAVSCTGSHTPGHLNSVQKHKLKVERYKLPGCLLCFLSSCAQRVICGDTVGQTHRLIWIHSNTFVLITCWCTKCKTLLSSAQFCVCAGL